MAEDESGGYTRLGDAWSFYKSRTNLGALRDIVEQYRKGLLKITIPKEISDIIARNPFNLNLRGIITDAGLWDMEPGKTLEVRPEIVAKEVATSLAGLRLLPPLDQAIATKRYIGKLTPKAKLGDVRTFLEDSLFYISMKPKYLNLITDVAGHTSSIAGINGRLDAFKKSLDGLTAAAAAGLTMDTVYSNLGTRSQSWWRDSTAVGSLMDMKLRNYTPSSALAGLITARITEWAKTYKPDIPALNIASYKSKIMEYANGAMDGRGLTKLGTSKLIYTYIPQLSLNNRLFERTVKYQSDVINRINLILKKYREVVPCLRDRLTQPLTGAGILEKLKSAKINFELRINDMDGMFQKLTNLETYRKPWSATITATKTTWTGGTETTKKTFSGEGFFGGTGLLSKGVGDIIKFMEDKKSLGFVPPGGAITTMKDVIVRESRSMISAISDDIKNNLNVKGRLNSIVNDLRAIIDVDIAGLFKCIPTITDTRGDLLPEFQDIALPDVDLWRREWLDTSPAMAYPGQDPAFWEGKNPLELF